MFYHQTFTGTTLGYYGQVFTFRGPGGGGVQGGGEGGGASWVAWADLALNGLGRGVGVGVRGRGLGRAGMWGTDN